MLEATRTAVFCGVRDAPPERVRRPLFRKDLNVTGTVKKFDEAKGYGFIRLDDGRGDVFVHPSAILMQGRRTLSEGQRVEIDAEPADRGPKAVNVQVVG